MKIKKVYIAKSKIDGKGIFARLNLKKNEVIFVASGRVNKVSKYTKEGVFESKS